MSTFTLAGGGVHALSTNVTALHVTVTALPDNPGLGNAYPQNYFSVALLRIGDASAYMPAFAIDAQEQWVAVPNGATRLGYACLDGTTLSVAEVIGGTPPFGGGGGVTTLAGLSDVALASLADAQVLTYQASTGKWINATPAGGSSGTVTKFGEFLLASAVSSVTFSSIPTTSRGMRIAYAASSSAVANNVALGLRFNGDTGANYDWAEFHFTATGSAVGETGGYGVTSAQLNWITGSASPAGSSGHGEVWIPAYSSTTFQKQGSVIGQWQYSEANGSLQAEYTGFRWKSTAAITSVTLLCGTGNFIVGSVFSLYLES